MSIELCGSITEQTQFIECCLIKSKLFHLKISSSVLVIEECTQSMTLNDKSNLAISITPSKRARSQDAELTVWKLEYKFNSRCKDKNVIAKT